MIQVILYTYYTVNSTKIEEIKQNSAEYLHMTQYTQISGERKPS